MDTEATQLTAPKRYYRIAIGVFFFLQGFTFASWAARIPDFKAIFSLSDGALGTLLFAFPFGQLLGVPIAGYLVERFTSRRTLFCAALLYPFTLCCLGFIPFVFSLSGNLPAYGVWIFALVLFILGMVANLHNLSVNTQAVAVEKVYGRSIMATFHGLWSLAGFAAGIVGSFMAARHIVPFHHYTLILLFGILTVVFLHRYTMRQDVVSETAKDEKPTFNIFKGMDGFVLLLGFLAGAGMVCEGTVYDWSAVYFKQVIGVSEGYIRAGYTACMLAMASCRFLADGIVNRLGQAKVMLICGLTTMLGFVMISVWSNFALAVIGSALVGLGVSAIVPICYSAVSKHQGVVAGRAINAVSTIGFFGFVAGPPVIGHLAQWIGLRATFLLIAALAACIALLSGKLRSKK
ncbi:MAG: MFS transporter [Bacteroides sp.]|nr:MFS transporter [Ruminococcus flavefaciens]MCM1554878.1 MFS transporter [Bacteroides sp.]